MAASVGNLVGVAGADKKRKQGQNMERDAQSKIDGFQWQDIDAAVPISTEGSDIMREENQRTTAMAIDASRSGGVRSVMSLIPQISAQNNIATRESRSYIDDQLQRRAYTKLGMTEQRQANELAGYGQMLNVGMAMKYQGYADLMNAGNSQSEHNMDLFNTFGGSASGGGGASGGGSGPMGHSDRRLKKNINLIGESPKGLPIYSFEYLDSLKLEGTYQGVMSDEIPQKAVVIMSDGFHMVDYSKIDVEFKKIT